MSRRKRTDEADERERMWWDDRLFVANHVVAEALGSVTVTVGTHINPDVQLRDQGIPLPPWGADLDEAARAEGRAVLMPRHPGYHGLADEEKVGVLRDYLAVLDGHIKPPYAGSWVAELDKWLDRAGSDRKVVDPL